ncbi:cyclin-D3-1-like [Aristolochia californica]|uniref:cyclin-D3-1-like n=1 Tax=Aristolochia californica TaxID=171875 RepID=UPI0035E1DCFF
MAPSFECVASSLLCPEDNNSIMGFDDDVGVVDGIENTDSSNNHKESFLGDFLMGLPLQSDECLRVMVERECEHLPREDYLERLQRGQLDFSLRRDAVNWIGKVHAYYSFGPLSAYLSINYLDRFLSTYELPQGKSWMMQLLSVACLSLAAKMEETVVPLILDLQVGESKYVFEARTIQRMELLVLSTLKWRMRAITPFSFLDCFLRKLNDGNTPPRGSISRSVELVQNTIRGIEFMGFRPSEIASAVAISVSAETETVDFEKAVSCFIHVQKERVQRCYEVLQDSGLISRPEKVVTGSIASVPQSPVGVLDAACFSYKSGEITVGSCANSHTTPPPKRRKLNRYSEREMKS